MGWYTHTTLAAPRGPGPRAQPAPPAPSIPPSILRALPEHPPEPPQEHPLSSPRAPPEPPPRRPGERPVPTAGSQRSRGPGRRCRGGLRAAPPCALSSARRGNRRRGRRLPPGQPRPHSQPSPAPPRPGGAAPSVPRSHTDTQHRHTRTEALPARNRARPSGAALLPPPACRYRGWVRGGAGAPRSPAVAASPGSGLRRRPPPSAWRRVRGGAEPPSRGRLWAGAPAPAPARRGEGPGAPCGPGGGRRRPRIAGG